MSGFWEAVERVRSGAAATAAPRPLSVFEPDIASRTDWNTALDFEQTAPLADEQPVDRATRREHIGEPAMRRDDAPAHAEPPPTVRAQTPAPPPTAANAAAPPAATAPVTEAAEIPAQLASAPAKDPTRPPLPLPLPLPAPAPALITSAATLAQSEPARPEPAAESPAPATTVTVTAAPPPETRPADPTRIIMVEAAPHHHAMPSLPVQDAPAPAADVASPPPLAIHIDRIEIHLDPPRPPAAAPARRSAPAAPMVDLNTFLARRAR